MSNKLPSSSFSSAALFPMYSLKSLLNSAFCWAEYPAEGFSFLSFFFFSGFFASTPTDFEADRFDFLADFSLFTSSWAGFEFIRVLLSTFGAAFSSFFALLGFDFGFDFSSFLALLGFDFGFDVSSFFGSSTFLTLFAAFSFLELTSFALLLEAFSLLLGFTLG